MIKNISIPVPQPTGHFYRGFSNTQSSAPTLPTSIRWTDDDHALVTEQADRLGVTFSEFVRWCAYHGAVSVRNYYQQAQFKKARKQKPRPDTTDFTDDTQ